MENQILIGSGRSSYPQEIILLQADVNYTNVLFSNGRKLTVATTLKILEKRLAECSTFFRTHKSYLINLNYIKNYHSIGEETFVEMKNDYRAVVSRRRKTAFIKKVESGYLPPIADVV
jgi:two-component system LytT family response regulator